MAGSNLTVWRGTELPFAADSVVPVSTVSGILDGHDFSYSLASIVIKKGRDFSQWPTTIFAIELPVAMPRMFIDSRVNNLPGLDAKAVNFVQAEDHQLEGDFPKYYSVRIEKNEHIDMYRVLTPEVMDSLKNSNHYDVWLNSNQLVLLTFGDHARYFSGLPEAFTTARLLMREIDAIARATRHHQM